MRSSPLLLLVFILSVSFSTQAQQLSEEYLQMNAWYLTKPSLDSTNILNQDTLILRQALRSGHRYYYDSTAISSFDVWNVRFGEDHALTLFSVQRPENRMGIVKRSDYHYTEMYPDPKPVWSKRGKKISLKIGDEPKVTFKIDTFERLELILVRME